VSDELIASVAGDAAQLRILRDLNLSSSVVVPLASPDGVIGTLSFAMAESGRRFSGEDASLITDLAARAALHIRNAQLYTERSHIARTLQAGLLPRVLPDIPGLEVAAEYLAAGESDVGGDFYDVFPNDEGVWTALIGDVTGKGPEAAAVTSLARHTLRTASLSGERPSENLRLLNRAMLADAESTRFCTVVYARVRPSPGAALITVANGGHLPPLLLRADGTLESIEVAGTLVGGVPDPVFADRDIRLDAGDLLLLYTDGVTELRTADPHEGEARLAEVLRASAGRTAAEVVAAVCRRAVELQGGRPRDDIAPLALRVLPSAA
jgi:serine phosphatase RsbU (regulator of sigma subunit)